MTKAAWKTPAREALAVRAGFDLATFDAGATPGWRGSKKDAERRMVKNADTLSGLQERLFAHGRSDGTRSVLLVLQGMDTAGKGGIVRHVVGLVDPQGVQHHSFGVPTEEEKAHHYLWRIRENLPRPGMLGVFDRSHYEDVLVVRVHHLVDAAVIESRYEELNAFEQEVMATGTTLVKVALMVSPAQQKARLRRRLERPDKYWKYNPHDVDERELWPDYQRAYQAVLDRTSTPSAPWHVIPADHKWYARLAVTELLIDALEGLDLGWPAPDFDVAAEQARLDAQPF